ncbi:MAG: glucose-1-phosphate cytidylyltransferase [Pseudomonadales bacterium]|nr:glucose-1-phosphate cytidylyltransferase [Pseudomonadales bacterium]
MKVVILAGGFGTRLSEETTIRPKPMVEIGTMPILWHIMKIYSAHGLNDFIVCLGYKGEVIKEFFANYAMHHSDIVFDLANNTMELLPSDAEPWRVTCVDTGSESLTGGRLKRVGHLLDDTFCLTYGDGVGDIDIKAAIGFHRAHGKLATLTAVQPGGRFGAFQLAAGGTQVRNFHEKPKNDGAWVNGGYFVLEPGVLEYIDGDRTVWERDPMERLSREGELLAWRHAGFWQPMDTLRDKQVLEELWQTDPPWKIWS